MSAAVCLHRDVFKSGRKICTIVLDLEKFGWIQTESAFMRTAVLFYLRKANIGGTGKIKKAFTVIPWASGVRIGITA
jgi:hypothetical protein